MCLLRSAALLNAVKKQRGHSTYLLNLRLSNSPHPTSKITFPCSLPESGFSDREPEKISNDLFLSEEDVVEIDRFMRELVVMSLIPWLERSVLDWHESVRFHRFLIHKLRHLGSIPQIKNYIREFSLPQNGCLVLLFHLAAFQHFRIRQ